MSNDTDLTPSVISLGKGLDLYSTPFSAAVGSLSACSNYEITDAEGLRRMDGMLEYDGTTWTGTTVFLRCTFTNGTPTAPSLGTIIAYFDGSIIGTTTKILGEVVDRTIGTGSNPDSYTVACSDVSVIPNGLTKLYSVNQTTGALTSPGNLASITILTSIDATAYRLANYMPSTGGNSLGYLALGLNSFKDKDYAVAPFPELTVTGRDVGNGFVTGTYTLAPTAGQMIGNSANSAEAYVISTTDATDGSGFKTYYFTIAILSGTYKDWRDAITAGASLTDLTITPGTAAVTQARPTALLAPTSIVAGPSTLWYCQPAEEAYASGILPMQLGWKPLMTNFLLNFNNGTYASATIPKLERTFATIPTTAVYYLTDGVNIFSCDLVSYFVPDVGGSFTTNNAAGTLQIRNIQLVSGTWDVIDNTYDLHSANPPTAPNKVADITSTMAINGLPSAIELIEAFSKIEFVNNNFYGDDAWEGMYGVTGAGRAFYYDEDLFASIYTQTDSTKDIPRHVSVHHQHLMLGFPSGSIQISVIGEPSNFLGLDGASEFALGDAVTGLLPLNGTTTAVFCRQSIRGISGSNVDNFVDQTLSPNVGCLEYTLANMGVPVFCDHSGIKTLEQSEKYGDFVGRPLSYKVNRLLRPRLSRVSGSVSSQYAPVMALPVRSKNQYRLYFADGLVLTMTMLEGGEPEFTTQYPLRPDSVTASFVIFAGSSVIDGRGIERLLGSSLNLIDDTYSNSVFAIDRGWGWGSEAIAFSMETNPFFGESPAGFVIANKCRLYGLSHGKALLKIASSGAQTQLTTRYNSAVELIDLPYTVESYSPIMVPRNSKPASVVNRGLALQIKISNRDDEAVAALSPSHVLQALVLSTTPGGAYDS